MVNWSRELIGRAGYYIHLAVSPANEDEILVSNSSFFQSVDGGQTFRSVDWGGDNHDIWWIRKDADRFAITHDAGITLTTAARPQHAARAAADRTDCTTSPSITRCRTTSTATCRTMGTMRGAITGSEGAGAGYNGIRQHVGPRLGGCESGFTIPDPADPNIVWATCYGNKVTRYDHRTKTARSVAAVV